MVLQTGLRYHAPLAGLIVFSAHALWIESLAHEASSANKAIPIFMAHGTQDPIVPHSRGVASCDSLRTWGYTVAWHDYPMPHFVCLDEVQAIGAYLQKVLGKV